MPPLIWKRPCRVLVLACPSTSQKTQPFLKGFDVAPITRVAWRKKDGREGKGRKGEERGRKGEERGGKGEERGGRFPGDD